MKLRFPLFATEVLVTFLVACTLGPTLRAQESVEGPDALPTLILKGSLQPRLPNDLTRIKFSPDGNYVLAQDSSRIFILTRQPFAQSFQIDALEGGPAQFTPDSAEVVFTTGGSRLSVERWSVASGKRTSEHEIALVGGCVESLLSPDGKSLACFSLHRDMTARLPGFAAPFGPLLDLDFELIDVTTGDMIVGKRNFVEGNLDNASFLSELEKIDQLGVSRMVSVIPESFSPDARYFAAALNKQAIAVDLMSRAVIPLHGDLEWILAGGFVFLSSERVLAENSREPAKSEVLEFPSGLVVNTIALGNQQIEAATRGNYLFLRPIKVAPLGVFDWGSRTMITALPEPTEIDIYDKYLVAQRTDGTIALLDFPGNKVEDTLTLPVGDLGALDAAAASADLRWLAISTRTRGAVWDLSTGERHYLLRGFSGASFDGSEALYADFPKLGAVPRSIVRADLSSVSAKAVRPIDETTLETKQYGRLLLSKIPAGKNPWQFSLTVQNARDGQTLWTQAFPKLTPESIAISPDENRVVFRWLAEQQPAMDEIKKDKLLKARYDKIAQHISTFLMQVLEADTGKPVGDVLIETSFPTVGPPPDASASGDWLFVTIANEQTRVYSISTGDLKATVPGRTVIASSAAGLFAVQPSAEEIQLYSLPRAEKRGLLRFSSTPAFVRFSGDARRLFVLTRDQNFYVFDAAKLAGSPK